MRNNCFPFLLPLFFALFPAQFLNSQTTIEGYVFEENNRGYLNQVKIEIFELPDNIVRGEVFSDLEGKFSTGLAPGKYRLVFKKDVFQDKEETLTVENEKQFLKIELKRKPGYLLDATIAEARESDDVVVDAIQDVDVEIYNRTQKRPELVKKRMKDAFFQFTFEQGNHYTILIRKPGYLAKRIEAYVNIEGCIICVHGVSNLRPGLTENLTAGNTMGTLLCNIELEKAKIDKRIALRNIYYDYDKWDIRPDAAKELNKAVELLLDNPGISVELGSHTDSRGGDAYNLNLSQKRAESAVAYIVSESVSAERITAKGYGETQLTNRCKNGATCSEEEHQLNRRTELKITGISLDSLEYMRWQSLEEIVREEEFRKALKEIENQEVVKIEAPKTEQPKADLPKQKNMPEANNSVPLPKFEPAKNDEPADEKNGEGTTEMPAPVSKKTLKDLPGKFTGFNIEIARTDIELDAEHQIFKQHGEIFVHRDGDGFYSYFIGNFDNLARARNFYQTVAVPKYPSARLCDFRGGVKKYLE